VNNLAEELSMTEFNKQRDRESMTVLVIENDPILIHFMSATMGKDGELTLSGGRPDNALRLIRTERPNVVLIETPTPVGDSINVCERIRAISNVPIIVALDKHDDRTMVEAVEAGADDYICKPIDSEELRGRIKASILRRRQSSTDATAGSTINFGDIIFDPNSGTILKAGIPVDISPREYQLLLFFTQNPNRLISCGEILRNVWGLGSEDLIDALRTAINRLRGKIEPDPLRPKHILSKRGMGYTFIPIPPN
jgi:DNA-binding response OmpR family regulator